MKLFKLVVHQKNFSAEDLIVNPKDYPGIKKGDIVEIYHPEDETSRLLLQVTVFKEDFQTRETISVEQTIAQTFTFQLRTYHEVYMKIVAPESVALDSLELTFKDQYMGRSEMWRLKKTLINTCVYQHKKIEFCSGSIRCQVYEMWSQGDRVACGVITEETKIVFRSNTSMVYLFLQMSSEMWDFDVHGDLYFEKAVNGFLTDLFQKWKKNGSFHEVTIVMFSRTFYEADSLDQFPQYMRDCLQQDYKGRFYEDFYRVAVQNERYEEWGSTLVQLRKLFGDYRQQVVMYHQREGVTIPKAVNSTASQGNFLEVLNMSLNVFEKHYLDRSFDRTGQLSVVITPGVGVFEVDRQVANVTKQRIIDNGVGSDLVCVGEQPLHAVPLLKFHNIDNCNAADDYSMPHWINLSFYSTNKKLAHCNFTPRIKLPPKRDHHEQPQTPRLVQDEEILPNSVFDYDAYDAQVFQLPNHLYASKIKNNLERTACKHVYAGGSVTLDGPDPHTISRKLSDPDIHHQIPVLNGQAIAGSVVGTHSHVVSGRALINPFDPSHVTIKLTSNRRRWTHIFPKGPTGVLIQQHHYQAIPSHRTHSSGGDGRKSRGPGSSSNANKTLLWGATGEQEWTPALTTGVDWKSLTIPACLPITTDYFPDKTSLCNDYLLSIYDLLPDDVNADYAQQRAIYKKPLSTQEVFTELISQRLAQGFQLIVLPNTEMADSQQTVQKNGEKRQCYLLSIGRIFHKISLCGSSISVTRYRPRHPYPPYNIQYRYRFQAPDHETYETSCVSFTTEKLENYSWNYLDHYICTRGDTDFLLVESLKYWRVRTYLLPLSWNASVTKRIMEGAEHCDMYVKPTIAEQVQLLEAFLRYLEMCINKLKRPNTHKKTRYVLQSSLLGTSAVAADLLSGRRRHSTALIALSHNTNVQSTTVGSSPFRDRLGSVRLPDKPRPRSGSKVMEKGRASPAAMIDSTPAAVTSDPAVFDDPEDNFDVKLKVTTPLGEIVEAMKHPVHGVGIFGTHAGLPSCIFSSCDAVTWLVNHVDGVSDGDEAAKIMNRMMEERLVYHASGDARHPFIIGFYLYHFAPISEKELKEQTANGEYIAPLGDLHSFQNEWVEVQVRHPMNWSKNFDETRHAQQEQIVQMHCHDNNDGTATGGVVGGTDPYRRVHLEIDVNGKSDRVEWGHCRYQSVFSPDRAYELVIEWEAASGPIVADLVSGWARKAQAYGLQMIPLPGDPLALHKSDPLRGPVFIPINTECLLEESNFVDYAEDTWTAKMIILQEAIVQRFGFIPCVVERRQPETSHHHHQYVHLTGNVFILIPSEPCVPQTKATDTSESAVSSSVSRSRPRATYVRSEQMDIAHSPHHPPIVPIPITRHVNKSNNNKPNHYSPPFHTKPGFLWFWNHMVSKRWRSSSTPATGDEAFQNKLLRDFREFCSNTDNRLRNFCQNGQNQQQSSASASSSPATNS